VLVLDALDLLLVDAHEDAVLYGVAGQVHRCLFRVPLWALQETSVLLPHRVCLHLLPLQLHL
jgi:hypothetical protein